MTNILITGGARSGKSDFAQQLADDLGKPVLFVATAEPGDEDMKYRITLHQRQRPADWRTLEASQSVGYRIKAQAPFGKVIIIDCITILVSNVLGTFNDTAGEAIIERAVTDEINSLVAVMKELNASFILVTNEVGEGVVPPSRSGRIYRDLLGRANQLLARYCDQVYLMVAGLPVKVKGNKL